MEQNYYSKEGGVDCATTFEHVTGYSLSLGEQKWLLTGDMMFRVAMQT